MHRLGRVHVGETGECLAGQLRGRAQGTIALVSEHMQFRADFVESVWRTPWLLITCGVNDRARTRVRRMDRGGECGEVTADGVESDEGR